MRRNVNLKVWQRSDCVNVTHYDLEKKIQHWKWHQKKINNNKIVQIHYLVIFLVNIKIESWKLCQQQCDIENLFMRNYARARKKKYVTRKWYVEQQIPRMCWKCLWIIRQIKFLWIIIIYLILVLEMLDRCAPLEGWVGWNEREFRFASVIKKDFARHASNFGPFFRCACVCVYSAPPIFWPRKLLSLSSSILVLFKVPSYWIKKKILPRKYGELVIERYKWSPLRQMSQW